MFLYCTSHTLIGAYLEGHRDGLSKAVPNQILISEQLVKVFHFDVSVDGLPIFVDFTLFASLGIYMCAFEDAFLHVAFVQ